MLARALLLSIVACAWPAAASAQTRVVLATRDPALESALEAALAPWQVQLVLLDASDPGSDMPGSAERGAALAHAYDAAAVTWISRDAVGAAALWIYDSATGRVVARALPVAPPFDEPTADAVALSIKTMLRHSAAAPEGERVVDPSPAAEWLLEIGAGVRALSTAPADAEPRLVLGAALWPAAWNRIVGVSLVARGGTGIAVAHNGASGRLGAIDLALGVRARIPVDDWIEIVLGLEVGASASWLDATVGADARHVTPLALDPTGALWAELAIRPASSLRIALRLGAFGTARTRSYLVRGVSILDTQPVSPFAEISFEIPLDGGRVDLP